VRCPSCSHDNRDAAKFCEECAAPLGQQCASCGAARRPNAKFCDECGAATAPTDAGNLRADTPKHLADKIRAARGALEGERKQVTVLFADVKGSMELAEQLDPEAWSLIMQRLFHILSEGVERFEGFVDKFTGDGIMALFGAPIAHEDHAQRACWTALHVRETVARYATEVKREHGVGFSMRLGIHSGEVVVGTIGDDLRMSYTAQGHTVGLAQRMEALASPDTCYLSATTAALVAGYFALEDLGEFRVKGLREPVRVHRLLGPGRARTRFDVSRARGLTRFVGRDADMRMLEDALAQAQAGTGQVVGVVAEAGTGKSRLCHELAERCRARGITVNFGRALAHGKHIPYLPMLEVFRAYYRIADGDDDRTAREKIAGRLLLLDEGLREALPVVFEFFGVPDPTRPVPPMDPDAKQRQIFAVLRRAIQDPDAGAAHLVVVIEDLHWLDAASEALVARWVDAVTGSSALLLVNFRPEYHAEWMQRSWYRQLPLASLGPAATRELLDDLLGTDPSIAGLAERIHLQTSGNPFFTEEVVQSLVDAGHLVGTRGAYRLDVDVATIQVPPSVHGLLSARIDRLPEREKLILQTAAVIGQSFTEPILMAVAELPEGEVRPALAALQAAEFVYEQTPFPVAEYVFKHPLTREVALRSQLQERRRRLHAAAARAIEAAHSDRLDAQAALLAHHWEEAGEAITAATWQMRAARWVRRRDFAAAAHHVTRALDLVRRAPDAPEAPLLGATVCRELLALGFRIGLAQEEAERIFAEGLAWAEHLDDPLFAGRLHQAISVLCMFDLHAEAALRHAAEWERAASAMPDPELRAYAKWPSLTPLRLTGDLEGARSNSQWQLDATKDHPAWGQREWTMSAQAGALWELSWLELLTGNLETARASAEHGIDIARGAGDLENQWGGSATLAATAFYAGEPEASRASVQRLAELGERLGSEWLRSESQFRVGMQLLLEGDARAAAELLERASAELVGRRSITRPLIETYLAESLRRVGETRRARLMLEETHARLREHGLRPWLAEAGIVLARIVRDDGGVAEADRIEALLDEVDAIVAQTGARLFSPFALVERAALAALRGDDQERIRLLRDAQQLFAEMGATGQVRQLTNEVG
jgi:class 3 adenylate cyclase